MVRRRGKGRKIAKGQPCDLAKCSRCGVEYPSWILSPMINNGTPTSPVCGICAQEMIGVELHGEIASLYRDTAIEWRKDHASKPRGPS